MLTGTQLFTGNTMLVLPAAQDRVSVGERVRDWSAVWIGNLVGSLAIAALFVASGATDALDGAVGRAALDTAATKPGKSGPELIASVVLANMLVCLAAWMAIGAKSVGGFVGNLLLVTAGNIVGGSLVAILLAAGHRVLQK
jgi:formate/nitrite transporter FocA (FNT family)